MVKSALEEYHISCRLNLVFGYMTIKTSRTTDPDIPVHQAIRVLTDIQCDIIEIGLLGDGLRSKFGITRDQCSERMLGGLTACNVFFREDNIAVMGSPLGLKLIRRIVVDCIVHKVDPVSFQAGKNLEDLHL
ncbi:unnamed protein product [Prunus armeniaca]